MEVAVGGGAMEVADPWMVVVVAVIVMVAVIVVVVAPMVVLVAVPWSFGSEPSPAVVAVLKDK